MNTVTDYLERHAPRLFEAWCWVRYRVFGRCIVCGRLVVLHTPRRLYVCERTPLPIELTDEGKRVAQLGREHEVA